jgi:hypothetical protein
LGLIWEKLLLLYTNIVLYRFDFYDHILKIIGKLQINNEDIKMVYDILIPVITVLLGYLITFTVYKTGLIRKSLYMNIWNMILLITIVISGLAGFVLLILLDMGVSISISPQLLYWHVEFGMTVAVVAIFHFHIYRKSFKSMFINVKRSMAS